MDTALSTTVTFTTRPATNEFAVKTPAKNSVTERVLEVVDPNGRIVEYMCPECSKTGPTYQSITGHLKAHGPGRRGKAKASQAPRGRLGEFIREHARLAKENERLSAKLKKERTARLRAERRIQQIESLFGPV